MDLIKVRFLDHENNPKGNDYTYVADGSFNVGDYVYIGESKIGIVTFVNVPVMEVESFKDRLKHITTRIEPFAFTFGTNTPLANKHVVILALNELEAIKFIEQKTPIKWEFCYNMSDWKEMQEKELDLGCTNISQLITVKEIMGE